MGSISTNVLLIILACLIVLSAFFSGAEIGMMSLNRYRLRNQVRKRQRDAIRVQRLLDYPDRLLGIILIGNNFANILAAAIASVLAVRVWGENGVFAAAVLLTLVVLIFSEMLPKTLAAMHPHKVACKAALPLSLLAKLLAPFVWLTSAIVNKILAWCGVNVGKRKLDQLSSEELRTMLHETGIGLPKRYRDMLVSILDMDTVTVEDVMVPKSEVDGVDLSDSWEEVVEKIESCRYTHLPLYYGNLSEVRGILDVRVTLRELMSDELTADSLLRLAQDCYFTPETTPINQQLLQFQKMKQHTSLVVDEYGEIQGLVTVADILEEIVGEFATGGLATKGKDIYVQAEDGSVIVDGSALVRELNRELQWNLPTDGPKTLSGLIIEYIEFIPITRLSTKIAGYPIEVMQVKDNMIKTVKVMPFQAGK